MQITLELPEDIAASLIGKGEDLPRAAMEALALEEYRAHRLSPRQLYRLLGFDAPIQLRNFLDAHGEIIRFPLLAFEETGPIKPVTGADLDAIADREDFPA